MSGGCISWKYIQLSQAKAEAETEFGKNNIPIAILLILPIFAHTDFSKFSKRSVQYWAKARFKLKIGESLAGLSVFWITMSDKVSYFSLK